MKPLSLLCLALAVGGGAELAARAWMRPSSSPPPGPVLEGSPPSGAGWRPRPDAYREVEGRLRSSSGWMADVDSGGRALRVAFIRWDEGSTANTLEAFKHLPEQCMGSIGMDLEARLEPRVLELRGKSLSFDATRFVSRSDRRPVFVYKAVWVAGHETLSLRRGPWSRSGEDLRSLRLAAAWNRFRPPHTRVVMGSIPGVPSEELAWREFRELITPALAWKDPAGTGEPPLKPDDRRPHKPES